MEVSSTFRSPPRLATVRGWRQEAPPGFVFSLRASSLITHPAVGSASRMRAWNLCEGRGAFCGHFRPSPEVGLAWESTRSLALALEARFVVLETPASFFPGADHLRDMYRFLKAARRDGLLLVWQPRGRWEPRLVRRVCGDLGLLEAVDPLEAPLVPQEINYLRLGRPGGCGELELRRIIEICRGRPSCVFFSHVRAWEDARRLEALWRA